MKTRKKAKGATFSLFAKIMGCDVSDKVAEYTSRKPQFKGQVWGLRELLLKTKSPEKRKCKK